MRIASRSATQAAFRGGYAVTVAVLAALLVTACSENDTRTRRKAQEYDPVADDWSKAPPMPVALRSTAVRSVGGLLYVAGGTGKKARQADHLYSFDPATDTWTQLADLPTGRKFHEMVAVGTDLHVMGGWEWDATNNRFMTGLTMDVFDTVGGNWSAGADLLEARRSHAAAEQGGNIYAFGGADVTPLDTAEAWTGAAWASIAPLPTTVSVATAESDGTFIYVMGDTSGTHVYDPNTDTWSTATPLSPLRTVAHIDSDVIGGVFYVFPDWGRDLFSYDPGTDTWTLLAPKTRFAANAGVGSESGLLYVVGGVSEDRIKRTEG